MSQKSYNNSPSLYLIPTPIGNMEDITIRCVNILKMVDIVLCEDTRVTDQLLRYLNIRKKLISCHDHNEDSVKESVINYLNEGKNIGLVTDRGTPIISDPGHKIVTEVIKNNYNVISLPGPTAFVPALTMSGLNPSPFMFYGFLNAKTSKREKELTLLNKEKATLIFYESPHRLADTLESIKKIFGDRNIAVAREISKLYEEVYRGTISEIMIETKDAKGEFVIVVEGNETRETFDEITLIEHVKLYLEDGISEKEAIKKVAVERDIPKSIVYKEYHIGK